LAWWSLDMRIMGGTSTRIPRRLLRAPNASTTAATPNAPAKAAQTGA